jgi:hypothetical protein
LAEIIDLLNSNSKEASESFENAFDAMNINIENVTKLIMESEFQRDKLAIIAREFSEWTVGIQNVLREVTRDLKDKLNKGDRSIITSRIREVGTYVVEVFNHLGKRWEEIGISILNAVEDGNNLVKSVLLERVYFQIKTQNSKKSRFNYLMKVRPYMKS